MKPRITLAETTLEDGSSLELQEHDERRYLLIHGQQICGPATRATEEELAKLAAAPFRPARQPRIWMIGLGLGHMLKSIIQELPQKRAVYTVAESCSELIDWNREFVSESALDDPRVVIESDPGANALNKQSGCLHAILIHLDSAPLASKQRLYVNDKRWIAATYEALQPGGLLAIAATRKIPNLTRNLERDGYEVVEHMVPASPNAKKPRFVPIWLARKSRIAE
jgi:spermidine synthase